MVRWQKITKETKNYKKDLLKTSHTLLDALHCSYTALAPEKLRIIFIQAAKMINILNIKKVIWGSVCSPC